MVVDQTPDQLSSEPFKHGATSPGSPESVPTFSYAVPASPQVVTDGPQFSHRAFIVMVQNGLGAGQYSCIVVKPQRAAGNLPPKHPAAQDKGERDLSRIYLLLAGSKRGKAKSLPTWHVLPTPLSVSSTHCPQRMGMDPAFSPASAGSVSLSILTQYAG